MCKLKTQHNVSSQASCTSQLIRHPPPPSLLPKSLEDSSHCSAAKCNLELARITPAVGIAGLKGSKHHLLYSLVVALAGWFFFSQRRVTWGYVSELVWHKSLLFGRACPWTLAILRACVCPPLLRETAFVSVDAKEGMLQDMSS